MAKVHELVGATTVAALVAIEEAEDSGDQMIKFIGFNVYDTSVAVQLLDLGSDMLSEAEWHEES